MVKNNAKKNIKDKEKAEPKKRVPYIRRQAIIDEFCVCDTYGVEDCPLHSHDERFDLPDGL